MAQVKFQYHLQDVLSNEFTMEVTATVYEGMGVDAVDITEANWIDAKGKYERITHWSALPWAMQDAVKERAILAMEQEAIKQQAKEAYREELVEFGGGVW